MNPLVAVSLWRHLRHHPMQLGLAVLGIALGVAVVLAVDLANHSARTSFDRSLERVTGQATHHIAGGPAGIGDALYAELRRVPGLERITPILDRFVDAGSQRLRMIGIDPLSEGGFGRWAGGDDGDFDVARLIAEPGAAAWAREPPGETMTVTVAGNRHELHRVGTLAGAGADGFLVVDIATAQVILDRVGRLDRIDLHLGDGATEELLATVRRLLPGDAILESAMLRGRATAALSEAFHINLTALSLLALVVGAFLIYNTMSFAVVQRRHLLGLLRALGVERTQLFRVILWEAALLGLAGTLIGLVLGIALAGVLLQLVGRTIDDLYHAQAVTALHIAPLSIARSALLGIGAALTAALLPALESADCPAGGALSRIQLEDRWRQAQGGLLLVSLAFIGAGFLALAMGTGLVSGFIALFLVMLACAMVTIPLLSALSRALQRVPLPLLGAMAGRDLGRHLSRTGVATAALMVALSAGVGVGVMVDSFRSGVEGWLRQLLNADVYISPAGSGSGAVDPLVLERLRAMPGIEALSLYRQRDLLLDGRIVYLIAAELASASRSGYRFIDRWTDPWTPWADGDAVLVSEPLAYRLGLKAGDAITLPAPAGELTLPIAAVFRDYGSEHGRVLIALTRYRQAWADPTVGSVAVFVPDTVREALEAALEPLQALRFSANADVLRASMSVFDRTFTITGVLRLLAVLVAFVGVLAALMAMSLERSREFAVLRAVGMSPGELSRLITMESALLGMVAGLAALPTGLVLARMLLDVINRRAFGWSLPFEVDALLLLQTLALAVTAALLAAVYPVHRFSRSSPAAALRTE